jgi:hypothetical protein
MTEVTCPDEVQRAIDEKGVIFTTGRFELIAEGLPCKNLFAVMSEYQKTLLANIQVVLQLHTPICCGKFNKVKLFNFMLSCLPDQMKAERELQVEQLGVPDIPDTIPNIAMRLMTGQMIAV